MPVLRFLHISNGNIFKQNSDWNLHMMELFVGF